MWWDYIGSPDMPECGEMRSLMGSWGTARDGVLLGPSRSWGSLGEIYRIDTVAGWTVSTVPAGEARAVLLGRLENWSRDLAGVIGSNFCPLTGQSRVVTGFLTGHNTLRRHLFLLGLADSLVCRGCGMKEETSAHVPCECEAWASLRHMHLGSFFLEPGDVKSIGLGAICGFGKATGLPWCQFGAQRACLNKA
jgi:hypothetical protein